MLLRILDRFEEILISLLMAAAVTLIFVAVVHRFSLGAAADLVGYGRSHDIAWLQSGARSLFKAIPDRFVVLSVSFQFRLGTMSEPVRYGELARALGIAPGARAPMTEVRQAVLELRRGKGMVLNADDHDTWSAGSFFTNPIVDAGVAEQLPVDAPRFPTEDGRVKSSAAWLIDHAGFGKGYGTPPATLSTKHTLALTNRGGGTTAELLDLARHIRGRVHDRFGIMLQPEPVLWGCAL